MATFAFGFTFCILAVRVALAYSFYTPSDCCECHSPIETRCGSSNMCLVGGNGYVCRRGFSPGSSYNEVITDNLVNLCWHPHTGNYRLPDGSWGRTGSLLVEKGPDIYEVERVSFQSKIHGVKELRDLKPLEPFRTDGNIQYKYVTTVTATGTVTVTICDELNRGQDICPVTVTFTDTDCTTATAHVVVSIPPTEPTTPGYLLGQVLSTTYDLMPANSMTDSSIILGRPSALPDVTSMFTPLLLPTYVPVYSEYTPPTPGSFQYNPLIPGSPEYTPPMPGSSQYTPSMSGSPQYTPPMPGNPQYTLPMSGSPQYTPLMPGSPQYTPPMSGSPQYTPPMPGSPQYTPPIAGSPQYTTNTPVLGNYQYSLSVPTNSEYKPSGITLPSLAIYTSLSSNPAVLQSEAALRNTTLGATYRMQTPKSYASILISGIPTITAATSIRRDSTSTPATAAPTPGLVIESPGEAIQVIVCERSLIWAFVFSAFIFGGMII